MTYGFILNMILINSNAFVELTLSSVISGHGASMSHTHVMLCYDHMLS